MIIDKLYYTYDIIDVKCMALRALIKTINDAIAKYGEENVSFEVETKQEPYSDYEYAAAYLQCKRNMTETEKAKEKARWDTLQKQREVWDREQYERLKRQFEGK